MIVRLLRRQRSGIDIRTTDYYVSHYFNYGLLLGAVSMMIYLCSMESFGVPYFAPFAPLDLSALKDSVLRFPLRLMKKRPAVLSGNRRRIADGNEIV